MTVHRLADAPTGCSAPTSIRSTRSSRSKACTSASSASAQKRDGARPVAGRVRRHPARPVSADVRLAAAADAVREAARPRRRSARPWTTRRWRCGSRGGLKPQPAGQLRHVHLGTVLGHLPSATSGIFAVLVGVVALSLVVGGIVIMNIMLMVVTERTREIGLRKALGAQRVATSWRRCSPSRWCCRCSAASSGRSSGGDRAWPSPAFTPIPAPIELWSVVLGIGITALVGLFFGLYPGDAGGAAGSRSRRCAANEVASLRSALREVVVHGVRHRAQQQDALGADRARRGHRHHVDRRHDVADPRLRQSLRDSISAARARTRSSSSGSASPASPAAPSSPS